MELKVEPRQGHDAAAERCPYCHDLILAAESDVLVICPACETAHHEACLAEIGRCTVHGCGTVIEVSPAALLDAALAEEIRRRVGRVKSAPTRAEERRLRDRARSFTREHCRLAQLRGATPANLAAAITAARAASAARRWSEAAHEYDQALRMFHVLDAETVRFGDQRVGRWQVEREAEAAQAALRGLAGDLNRLALTWLAVIVGGTFAVAGVCYCALWFEGVL